MAKKKSYRITVNVTFAEEDFGRESRDAKTQLCESVSTSMTEFTSVCALLSEIHDVMEKVREKERTRYDNPT